MGDDFALSLGNLLLLACLLMPILLVHVAIISAIEAYWNAKVSYLVVQNRPG